MAPRHIFFGYAWIPLIAASAWFATLVALLSIWTAEGKPRYQPSEGSLVYISDIGAHIKPLFIAGTSITGPFFVFALATERYLRHKARLHPNLRRREKIFSVFAVLFAAGGAASLISLSIKDAFNYHTLHWQFTVAFILCISLSAIFTTAEWGWLRADHRPSRLLRYSYAAKIAIVILAIVFSGVMAKRSVAAGCEWAIAFLFDAYLWTLVLDLYPAINTGAPLNKNHFAQASKDIEKGQDTSTGGPTREDYAKNRSQEAHGSV